MPPDAATEIGTSDLPEDNPPEYERGITNGRIAHYNASLTEPRCQAAMVVHHFAYGTVNLAVFPPKGGQVQFRGSVPHDEGAKGPYTWHWPERDEE